MALLDFIAIGFFKRLLKWQISTLAVAIILFVSSCNSNSGASKESNTDSNERPKVGFDSAKKQGFKATDSLYTLYIQNDAANQQLGKLLGGNGANKEKLTLQFYRDSSGHLGLMLLASKKKNIDFTFQDTVMTYRSKQGKLITSGNQPVLLGEMQIFDEPGGQGKKYISDSLKRHIYNANDNARNDGWEYIWFEPEIKSVSNESNTFRANYIIYKVRRSSSVTALEKKAFIDVLEAKPSPPRNLE